VIVAKVGGSLYDEPRLGPALRLWAGEQPEPVLLVPGGGEFADAVRKLDRVHRLGEEAAHWLAIRSLDAAAVFLRQLVGGDHRILDPFAFFREHDLTPHTWDVTTDSLALAAARHLNASKLVLLKSTDIPPGTPWAAAAARGWVDNYFPELVHSAAPVEPVNFRRWVESRFGRAADDVP
jgi:aspartokinase-like uncharacterized kinase